MAERKILPSVSMDELKPENASTPLATGESRSNFGLTFEQQKELLEMQQREREAERETERREREAERREREAIRQLEYDKIRSEQEIALERLRLIAEGKINGDTGGDVPTKPARSPDISNMARLLPRFNEKDPDVFFSLFESVSHCSFTEFGFICPYNITYRN